MPFTFAHPALVIPFKKWGKPLSLTGLIMGSMSPDFEFFLRMKVGENISHHGYGIFIFDIPVSLFLCYLFHNQVRDLLLENLPTFFRSRLQAFHAFPWNSYAKENFLWVLLSINIGILSHFLSDSFTHVDGFFVQVLPLLNQDILYFGIQLPVYLLLQILSSLGGLIYIYYYIQNLPNKPQETNALSSRILYWSLWIGLSLSVLSLRWVLWTGYKPFWDIIMSIMGSGMWGLWISSLILRNQKLMIWLEESR
jgi:hypothetical protein